MYSKKLFKIIFLNSLNQWKFWILKAPIYKLFLDKIEIKKNINNFMKNYLYLFFIKQLYYIVFIVYILNHKIDFTLPYFIRNNNYVKWNKMAKNNI